MMIKKIVDDEKKIVVFSQNVLFVKHNFIKNNEAHIKTSGDHDGGNIKLLYKIANVFHPYCTDNSVLFSILEGKDFRSNIKVGMTRFRERISALQTTKLQ